MTREVMDNFEDHLNSIRTEWHVMKEKWFHGETMDPVFEGTVRDFCTFDETMHSVYNKVQVFMRGVESLANGMTVLSEGVSGGLSRTDDQLIASGSCKLKEATNQIARADAPHSAIAKLRRDMHFNILSPVQNHIANNRNLKVSLDIRRRRLIELNSAKKHFEEVVRKNIAHTDRRYMQAQSTFESAKVTFNDVDRHVFEWLYILEEYRGDILDSTLQTLKYLEYEFFASSAHAISTSLPSRMEFRPMVEMTPEHLEAQVEMELQKSEDTEVAASTGASDTAIVDFSARLIDKKVKEDPGENDPGPALPVDPLSLSSLLSQGFEEGPARRALRKHQNDTQAALDWLINGQGGQAKEEDAVRMPTTVKRVQKLKAMRRAQQEKLKEKKDAEGASDRARDEAAGPGHETHKERPRPPPAEATARPPPPEDMLTGGPPDLIEDILSGGPPDLLEVERTELPPLFTFDTTKCEKQPLAAAVAAGLAQPRPGPSAGTGGYLVDVLQQPWPASLEAAGVHGLDFCEAAAPPAPSPPAGSAAPGGTGGVGMAPGFSGALPLAASASGGGSAFQDSFGDLVNLTTTNWPAAGGTGDGGYLARRA